MSGPYHTYHLRSSVWQRYNTTSSGGVQLWIGATVTDASANNDISNFETSDSIIGPLQSRRTFVAEQTASTFPTDIAQTAAGADVTAGIHPFLSCKGDPVGIANGDYDGVITQLLQSFPSDRQCWFTMWHEPENNMPAAQFVAMFQHMYTIAKAANPAVLIGPVYGGYQWRPTTSTTTVPDNWFVGSSFCDFMSVDMYWQSWRGATPKPLQTDPYHQRWHSWASTKGKPLYVTERGVQGPDATCASVLLQDETWMKANGYGLFMYWDAIGSGNVNWIIDNNPATASAWQQIASRGRTS